MDCIKMQSDTHPFSGGVASGNPEAIMVKPLNPDGSR
jgi:hypothetical protein